MAKMNNLAYDYSAYDREFYADEKKIRHRQNTALLKRKNSLARFIGIAVVTMTLMFLMIYGKVELSSLYDKQAQMEVELAQLINENISLESELATYTTEQCAKYYDETMTFSDSTYEENLKSLCGMVRCGLTEKKHQ